MNDAFWVAWKAAVPVLAVVVVLQAIKLRWMKQDIAYLDDAIGAWRRLCDSKERKMAQLQSELADAKGIADVLRSREQATCPCSEVKAANERVAHLTERNNQMVFDALANNAGRYIKINRN